MLQTKRILLIVGGGIAAYKVLELIRRLKERGASVRAVMTRSAKEFVTPLTVGALTGEKVHDDLFDLTAEADIGHIRLSREADLVVVAPATADLMAKMAHGLCDDLATNILLATDKPVLVCPAMNPRMWAHPATRRNAETLRRDGVRFLGPNVGAMAERGESGPGRLAEPMEILAAIEAHFARLDDPLSAPLAGPLSGKTALVTSGPTHEPIDPVRYIANRSSGKQGHAIAAALARLGANVTLVSGPVTIPDPAGVTVVRVETAREMLAASLAALPADIAVMAAAVADWRTADAADAKMKKDGSGRPPALALTENPDILATIGHHPDLRPTLVVGFAAETGNVAGYARDKLARKGADLICANDVSPEHGVFGGDANTLHLVGPDSMETWPTLSKVEVAERLAGVIAARLGE
ncbi:bifunctional phosphopantothenoylcysteine decarboxylase/phosphopantothenate--cysteine ligase CoaBC [Methylobrevis pamukkalensis]|uniref:Coenzyme A biosynthesis bifunctional protein CoaBC n=1 Tax=Methylobrevis pamukkalensis TaxID=1439726 RepID=A0A1E3GWE9_9HYPH|nr:bifunctional phosphopantothenoylcysteine decarboxylase/phosphopantothenate--cysteine ligase CoaBC [Methylobrevis pamukkalensis]ODN68377.1 Coenzyme A biosynthesis bifunctional protein CoaBC [Methylobrevis pamukkalensis]